MELFLLLWSVVGQIFIKVIRCLYESYYVATLDIQTPKLRSGMTGPQKHTLNTEPQEVWLDV